MQSCGPPGIEFETNVVKLDPSGLAFCLGEHLSFSCPPDSFKTRCIDKQFEGAAGHDLQ